MNGRDKKMNFRTIYCLHQFFIDNRELNEYCYKLQKLNKILKKRATNYIETYRYY